MKSNETEILSFDGFESKEQKDFESFMMRYKSEFRDFKKVGDFTYSNILTSIAYDSYLAGQQSKQDEIDELQKNFNNALKTIDIQQQFLDDTDGTIKIITSQVDELQNRIDDLKSFCIKGVESNMLSIEYNQALIDMHKILKGEETK